ncbi:hypothetical protein NQ315_004648 [Exocentrus adspersus]|uniref:Uncharacterized protein n=1 Tax=Exocentrus adspersus TaxID=1586481 RepID=A0AAV8VPA0_9CUCU|nr:hypothetical protein NQ315_004648 [Exocentrus adspersus]
MQGKLMTKSKVIQTNRPKSQLFRRRVKPERASTPQRWSRRIRSLPPIPINVLYSRRKRKPVIDKEERCTSTSNLEVVKLQNVHAKVKKERRENVFINKSNKDENAGSMEVVRIVPVVVYVKNPSKQSKAFLPEEIRVHINDNPTCQMVSKAISSKIREKIKHRKLSQGKEYTSRTKTPRLQVENMVQAAKRISPTRKKLLLYQ